MSAMKTWKWENVLWWPWTLTSCSMVLLLCQQNSLTLEIETARPPRSPPPNTEFGHVNKFCPVPSEWKFASVGALQGEIFLPGNLSLLSYFRH